MSWVYRDSKDGVTARKKHACYFCNQPINAGEKYDIRNGLMAGEGHCHMRMHPECHQATLDWSEDDYESFSPGTMKRGGEY